MPDRPRHVPVAAFQDEFLPTRWRGYVGRAVDFPRVPRAGRRAKHDPKVRQRERAPPAVEQEHRRAKEVAQREQHAVRQVCEHEHPQEDAQPLEGTTKPAPDRLPVTLAAMSAGLNALLLLVHAQ